MVWPRPVGLHPGLPRPRSLPRCGEGGGTKSALQNPLPRPGVRPCSRPWRVATGDRVVPRAVARAAVSDRPPQPEQAPKDGHLAQVVVEVGERVREKEATWPVTIVLQVRLEQAR